MDAVSDTEFLYCVLADGDWHAQDEILARSIRERGHGLTVHSRAATLRERGHHVDCDLRRNRNGRVRSFYRLTLNEPADTIGEDLSAGSLSVPATTDGAEELARVSPSPPAEPAGTLLLFTCEIDESAGLRGAYGDDAA